MPDLNGIFNPPSYHKLWPHPMSYPVNQLAGLVFCLMGFFGYGFDNMLSFPKITTVNCGRLSILGCCDQFFFPKKYSGQTHADSVISGM